MEIANRARLSDIIWWFSPTDCYLRYISVKCVSYMNREDGRHDNPPKSEAKASVVDKCSSRFLMTESAVNGVDPWYKNTTTKTSEQWLESTSEPPLRLLPIILLYIYPSTSFRASQGGRKNGSANLPPHCSNNTFSTTPRSLASINKQFILPTPKDRSVWNSIRPAAKNTWTRGGKVAERGSGLSPGFNPAEGSSVASVSFEASFINNFIFSFRQGLYIYLYIYKRSIHNNSHGHNTPWWYYKWPEFIPKKWGRVAWNCFFFSGHVNS